MPSAYPLWCAPMPASIPNPPPYSRPPPATCDGRWRSMSWELGPHCEPSVTTWSTLHSPAGCSSPHPHGRKYCSERASDLAMAFDGLPSADADGSYDVAEILSQLSTTHEA